MKYMSIMKRWLLNVASIVLVILIVVSVSLFMIIRNYYYGAAKMTVEAMTSEEISSIFNMYGASTSGFENAAREYCENFSSGDTMAVWVIDKNARVIVTSSGFAVSDDVEISEYADAKESPGGSAIWTGRLPSGEKIMANTCIFRYENGRFGGAIRYMVSLDAIDRQLVNLAFMILAVAVLMFAVLLLSGMAFIRSIVNPVKEIGETAKKIAGGDLGASIDHYPYNDEIGELCATINDMADKLSESDKMKNDFISTISHELRTPLTAIKGWGETLQQIGDSDPAMTKRGMDIIISESTRLNGMVEDLLDFSRISSGRMIYNTERIDFLAELDDVAYSFKDRAYRNGIELAYNAPAIPAPGNADPSRIKQVFINILDNAIKYTEEGGTITISAAIEDKKKLVVVFEDSGAGIAPEDLPHIKEKFYKANNTVRGSGIGLAVCDEIVKYHGGTMDIDSVLGEGTKVTVTLPLEIAVKQEKHEKEESENE